MDLTSFPVAVGRVTLASAPEGLDAFVVARLAGERGRVLHVARDDARLAALVRAIAFVDPSLRVLTLPAWDCLPYDRVSPNGEIVSRRVETLAELASTASETTPLVVLTTVNAVLQRLPPRQFFDGASLTLKVGDDMPLESLLAMFTRSGYGRTDTVREPGEFAVRGGIIDVFPTGMDEPARLDFFGDELEAVRTFIAASTGVRQTGQSPRRAEHVTHATS